MCVGHRFSKLVHKITGAQQVALAIGPYRQSFTNYDAIVPVRDKSFHL